MEFDQNFDQNIKQLIKLLKKIMSHHGFKGKPQDLESHFKKEGMNMNLYVFNFITAFPEDLDDLDDLDDYGLFDKDNKEELSENLTASDLEFLRRNGIRF